MKLKLVSINLSNVGSTGVIMREISEKAETSGMIAYQAYPWDPNNKKPLDRDILIGNKLGRRMSIVGGLVTGFNGCFSVCSTLKFLYELDKIKPDIIHLHNLHNCYINLPMLFGYIKKHNIRTVWTLHDCWAFTGQCPHFTMVKCDRWKTGCHDCSQYKKYPQSIVDRTKTMWRLKKKWFTGVENLTIVTPSQWLAELVKESFLKEYPVRVINNGIDLNVFKPTDSDFRERYGIGEKKIVLGVAFGWGERKGLDMFLELSRHLASNFQIVLVGTDGDVDKVIPKSIVSLHRTQNQKELAEIYSVAAVFANPTREENYPTVNMEALACGTPVVTFNTGGSPEMLDSFCGKVIDCEDIKGFVQAITEVCAKRNNFSQRCLEKSESFNKDLVYEEYISLYFNRK